MFTNRMFKAPKCMSNIFRDLVELRLQLRNCGVGGAQSPHIRCLLCHLVGKDRNTRVVRNQRFKQLPVHRKFREQLGLVYYGLIVSDRLHQEGCESYGNWVSEGMFRAWWNGGRHGGVGELNAPQQAV